MVKKTLLSVAIAASVAALAGCNVSTTDRYDDRISNAGVQTAQKSSFYPIFAPEKGDVPLAIDFLFADAGASDGTANTAADPNNPVITALNKLDGFSTVAPHYIEFSEAIDPDSVVAGQSVFLIALRNATEDATIDALDLKTILYKKNPSGWPTKEQCQDETAAPQVQAQCKHDAYGLLVENGAPVQNEKIFSEENQLVDLSTGKLKYEARAITMDDGRTPAIQILLKEPLQPKTKYLVVVTDAVKSASGEAIGQAATYAHAIGSDKLMSAALAPVRPALQGWKTLADGFLQANKVSSKSVFNYAFTTGGTTDVLKAMAAPTFFVHNQVPTVDVAEGAIIQATIDGALKQAAAVAGVEVKDLPAETRETVTAGAINSANGTLEGIATEVIKNLSSQAAALDVTDRATLKASALAIYYHKALVENAIAPAKSLDLTALKNAIDAPKSRDYNAIVSQAGAVAVSYDDFFSAQIEPVAKAEISKNVSDYWKQADPSLDEAGIEAKVADALENGTTLVNAGGPGVNVSVLSLAQAKNAQLAQLSSHGSIYQGGLTIPNYLPDSEAEADAALGTWVASDDAAKALGLPGAPRDIDGVSTNVTYRFPFAEKQEDMSVVPVMATLPADAGDCKKSNFTDGYPVVIYQHGITVDRTAGVLVGNALAKACVAMVAIDHVMHGVAPGNATGLTFNVETVSSDSPETKSPFAAVRAATVGGNTSSWMANLHERHNNVGKDADKQNVKMEFAAAGADADMGASGDLYINLNNFARTRDAMRQTVMDMLNLNASLENMKIDGTNTAFDTDNVYFIGHSLGGIVGATFVAVNNDPLVQTYNTNLPKIKAAILGNPGGGVVKLLENSPGIGAEKILPGLSKEAGLEQGSADIEKFFGVMQAMVDSADPINFASAPGLQDTPVLMYTAVGDLVVPNNAKAEIKYTTTENEKGEHKVTGFEVGGAPTALSYLSGTDPLAKALKLVAVEAEKGFVEGTRFNVSIAQDKGDHSTFSNAQPQETFTEIFTQIGSFLRGVPAPLNKPALEGVLVTDKDVLEGAE